MTRILIVDDEVKIGRLLEADLTDAGYSASSTTDPREALQWVIEAPPDVVVTDLRMDAMDGVALLSKIHASAPGVGVIIMTAYASLETAIEAMRCGAYDYIIKPFQSEELLILIERLISRRKLEAQNEGLRSYTASRAGTIVGTSSAIENVRSIISRLSGSDASVMIRGESGTGKELVARAIHSESMRSGGPFIALNCAAIPEPLLESELFGYEKGAFTGADKSKPGHFQMADGGTLFLDEVGDLPMSLQAKLLRVLETRRITPLGGVCGVDVNIRLVSATHRPLEDLINERVFREDLFYRLNVFPIEIPPLRDRREDIRTIAEHFLTQWGRPTTDLSDEAASCLAAYDWPGNVRELRNVLERATILCANGPLHANDILVSSAAGSPAPCTAQSVKNTLNLAQSEKQLIERALAVARGNKSEAARLLGITRRALYGRLERYEIDVDEG